MAGGGARVDVHVRKLICSEFIFKDQVFMLSVQLHDQALSFMCSLQRSSPNLKAQGSLHFQVIDFISGIVCIMCF